MIWCFLGVIKKSGGGVGVEGKTGENDIVCVLYV